MLRPSQSKALSVMHLHDPQAMPNSWLGRRDLSSPVIQTQVYTDTESFWTGSTFPVIYVFFLEVEEISFQKINKYLKTPHYVREIPMLISQQLCNRKVPDPFIEDFMDVFAERHNNRTVKLC